MRFGFIIVRKYYFLKEVYELLLGPSEGAPHVSSMDLGSFEGAPAWPAPKYCSAFRTLLCMLGELNFVCYAGSIFARVRLVPGYLSLPFPFPFPSFL